MSARLLLLALLSSSAGCLGEYALPLDDAGVTDAGVDGDVDAAGPTIEEEFARDVAPILGGPDGQSGACGACHVAGKTGPAFMEPNPTMLDTILSIPGLIGDAPETSRLYTKGAHAGPAFTSQDAPVVAAWILKYNAVKPKAGDDAGVSRPSIKPAAPNVDGTTVNTLELSELDPAFAGHQVTFVAKMVGSTLQLSQVKIKTAGGAMGLHVVHPLFVRWDDKYNPFPDPADSFQTLDTTVPAGEEQTVGAGYVFLPDFGANNRINVVFTIAELKQVTGGEGGPVVRTCKNTQTIQNFAANVRPQLAGQCYNCHGNGTAGLTMNAGLADAALCNNVILTVDFANPAQSRLLSKPNPGVQDGHPVKHNNYGAFSTAVNNWINLEK